MPVLRTLRGVDVRGKRVLTRVDCNVAVDDEGRPVPGGEQRLRAILPTIEHLRAGGARVVLLTHLGRPGGTVVASLRLDDLARRLGVLLGQPVRYMPDIRGERARAAVGSLTDGDVLLLENLRFDPGEETADEHFAADLAQLGDLVVQDAFGVSHRNHASVAVLPRLLPAYPGFLLAKEVEVLRGVLENPARPAVAIVGGAKLETKLRLLNNLLPRVDHLLTGGGMANTLLKLSGVPVRAGLVADNPGADVHELFETHRSKIHLPVDVHVVRGGGVAHPLVLPVSAVGPTDDIADVGPETARAYCAVVRESRTCLWNGPLGRFEDERFAAATRAVAACVRGASNFSVVGGGDTVRAFTSMGLLDHFDHVSTGGGAMLAFLESAPMPGLEPLYT